MIEEGNHQVYHTPINKIGVSSQENWDVKHSSQDGVIEEKSRISGKTVKMQRNHNNPVLATIIVDRLMAEMEKINGIKWGTPMTKLVVLAH